MISCWGIFTLWEVCFHLVNVASVWVDCGGCDVKEGKGTILFWELSSSPRLSPEFPEKVGHAL